MSKFRKIGILTSGGDAPGMNACLRAVARKALNEGVETIGIKEGYNGLINNDLITLSSDNVRGLMHESGTRLYSSRCLEFKTEEGMKKALDTCEKNHIDAIIAIGGDGTFRGALDLTAHGIPSVGLPGTIDNDITASDYTIGFDTAMNTTISAIDELRVTCESHKRCNVIEVMGRGCGQIALQTGLASGAVAVAVPEIPFDADKALERMRKLRAAGKRSMLVVISEGCITEDGKPYSEVFYNRMKNETEIETKFYRAAHTVRGGVPSLRDRVTASAMGVVAVEELLNEKSDEVICEIDGRIVPVDIRWALAADRMYKNKLKPGELDMFSAAQVEEMKQLCAKRKAYVERLYYYIDVTADRV